MAKYVIDTPDEVKWIQYIQQTGHGTINLKVESVSDLIPYTEPDEIKNNKVNLCTSCKLFKEHFPECGDVNVLFGDGMGNDNICCCSGYVAKNEDEIRQKVEQEVWDFARRIICPSDCCEDSISKYTEKFLGIPSHKARAIFKDLSYQEVKAKYETWKKQKDEIHVGDEVFHNGAIKTVLCIYLGILTLYGSDGHTYYVVRENENIKKTGRHFPEVEELLKKMKGE